MQVNLEASGDGSRVELKSLEARSGEARAAMAGTAERSPNAWRVRTQASLVDFDPRPWFPGAPNSAWQAGPHRLNLKADADLSLPDAAAGTRKPTPLARAACRLAARSSSRKLESLS